MSIQIYYKNKFSIKNPSNLILFVDEKFSSSPLKKHISNSEYAFVSDLIKTKDLKKNIASFDVSSKKKIILVSIKKNYSNSEIENLGAKFYEQFNNSKIRNFYINSNSLPSIDKNIVGYFLHGLNLKSYKFDKYKSKKNKNNITINVLGKNIPSSKDQLKFKAIEEGTFYTRDLVSEPGNILHPDEYAKRLNSLKKLD